VLGQFVAMLFCQPGAGRSLREICNGLAASERKLRHWGIPSAPNRSTLSFAFEQRPGELYQTGFEELLDRRYSLDAPFQTPPLLAGVHDSQLALGFRTSPESDSRTRNAMGERPKTRGLDRAN
jgi:hypothetical protein